jgi:hypothetical protein
MIMKDSFLERQYKKCLTKWRNKKVSDYDFDQVFTDYIQHVKENDIKSITVYKDSQYKFSQSVKSMFSGTDITVNFVSTEDYY